jgi:hypothetical protein
MIRPKLLLVIALVIVAGAVINGCAERADAASYKQCRSFDGDNIQFYNVTASKDVRCSWTQVLAINWETRTEPSYSAGRTRIKGWTCRARQTGPTMDVRCTTTLSVVRFHVTADL